MARRKYVRGRSLKDRVTSYFSAHVAPVQSVKKAYPRLRRRFGISDSYLHKLAPMLKGLNSEARLAAAGKLPDPRPYVSEVAKQAPSGELAFLILKFGEQAMRNVLKEAFSEGFN